MELILDGKRNLFSLAAGTPPPRGTTAGIHVPPEVPLYSQGLTFNPLGSYSHLLDPCCLSLVGCSLTCQMLSLWSPQSHFSLLVIIHLCNSYTQVPFQPTSRPEPRWPHSDEPCLDSVRVSCMATRYGL